MPVKNCKLCGAAFYKRARDSSAQWSEREFCSIGCANKSKRPITPPIERFWNFVDKRKNGCWKWLGSVDHRGYGRISAGRNLAPLKAHRISWEIHFGAISANLNVLHACDNPGCVNPDHLMLGTQKANAVDMSRKGRINIKSLDNLRPGQKGVRGAGNQLKENRHGISE